jgi:hypothetical protein
MTPERVKQYQELKKEWDAWQLQLGVDRLFKNKTQKPKKQIG